MLLNLVPKIDFIWIVSCSCSNHTILQLIFVAEKVQLLLVIFLTAYTKSSKCTTANNNQGEKKHSMVLPPPHILGMHRKSLYMKQHPWNTNLVHTTNIYIWNDIQQPSHPWRYIGILHNGHFSSNLPLWCPSIRKDDVTNMSPDLLVYRVTEWWFLNSYEIHCAISLLSPLLINSCSMVSCCSFAVGMLTVGQIEPRSACRSGRFPDSKVHGANMGPTWVLWAPDGPHVGPMNLAIRLYIQG